VSPEIQQLNYAQLIVSLVGVIVSHVIVLFDFIED
jgi:hypothetical protein